MDIPVIVNRKNFLFQQHPEYHPESLKYIEYWRFIKGAIINGYWGKDCNSTDSIIQWRFMPPQLFFYVNCCHILHKEENAPKTAPRKKVYPNLDDVDWDFFYKYMECRGFSGFKDDEEYTCLRDVQQFNDGKLNELDLPPTAYNKKKKIKTYIPAREYIMKTFLKPMGLPLYDNEAKNLILLSARGLGKSYWLAQGCILHEIITDGAKEYTEESIKNPAKVEVFVGAAMASKSSEMLEKTQMGMDNLPGIWKKGTEEEVPSPLYKKMSGTLSPNNIKNPWKCEYEKKLAGEWKKVGSGSNVKHGIWTIENPEAAAGGRYNLVVCEEVGLLPNSIAVHMSNIPTQYIEYKFGSALYLGTGGNIEKIQQTQVMFCDPEGFDMLEFDDEWEGTGKIGYFIPATYSNRKFKDENGNTKVKEATDYYNFVREKKKKARSSNALDMEMMNYPLIPSEMFLNKAYNKFPLADLKQVLSKLLTSDSLLGASYKGEFTIEESGTIKWTNKNLTPIREFPVRKSDSNLEGCWEIFQMPMTTNDNSIPYGRYIACLDPIDDDDNSDVTRSLQSCFIFDMFTDKIVAEYTGRTKLAKEYYEQVRRGLIFYNAQMLYENQKKGLFAYFDNKNSTYLLADTPDMLKDMDMQKIISVGNRAKGIYATEPIKKWGIDLYAQWLQSQAVGMPDGVMNVTMLRSVGLIRESIMYSKDINADRISSIIVLMIFRETKVKYVENKKKDENKYDIRKDPKWDMHYGKRDKGYMNPFYPR